MTIQEQVEKLSTLIKEIKHLDNAARVAIRLNDTYARINIRSGTSNAYELHDLFTVEELTTIGSFIYDAIITKKETLLKELNSYVIAKQL